MLTAFQVDFSHTVNMGAVVLALLIIIAFAWATRQDKRSERWQKLYDLADSERKEIQTELNEARIVIAEQKEVIQKLESLQMPTRVMEMMAEGMKSLNEHAAERQSEIRESIRELGKIVEQLPVIERLEPYKER